MYERLKSAVKKHGEVMVITDAGEEHELHLHNTTWKDDDRVVKVDAATAVHWLDGDKIERYWIHKDF